MLMEMMEHSKEVLRILKKIQNRLVKCIAKPIGVEKEASYREGLTAKKSILKSVGCQMQGQEWLEGGDHTEERRLEHDGKSIEVMEILFV